MSASLAPSHSASAALAFEAAAEAAGIARAYSETAATFAAIGDARGLAYAIRCAAAALSSASLAAQAIRGQGPEGGR